MLLRKSNDTDEKLSIIKRNNNYYRKSIIKIKEKILLLNAIITHYKNQLPESKLLTINCDI